MKVFLVLVAIVVIAAAVAGGAMAIQARDKLHDANECTESQWVDDAVTDC